MGFCRTNLFKRLESSGEAFLQSVERHALRNYVFLHAIRNGLPLPLGTQDAEMLDLNVTDEDEAQSLLPDPDYGEEEEETEEVEETGGAWTVAGFEARASEIYAEYEGRYKRRFKWLRSNLFRPDLEAELRDDSNALSGILQAYGRWDPKHDVKLKALPQVAYRYIPRGESTGLLPVRRHSPLSARGTGEEGRGCYGRGHGRLR